MANQLANRSFRIRSGISNAAGYSYTILHNFDVSHGAYPQSGLTFGSDGLLYGTTPADAKTPYPAAGTAFSLSPEGDKVEFKSFAPFGRSTPGGGPSNLTRILPGPSAPASDFIGTTDPGPIGVGPNTVFLLRTNNGGIGGASVAYTFGVAPGDVTAPVGAPIQGMAALGGLYFGCALFGGANGHGGVYQLTPNGTGTFSERVLFSFGPPSATEPSHACSIVQGSQAGTLYGTTDGSGDGVLFALSPPTTPGGAWTESDLTDFFNMSNAEGALARIGNELFQTFEYPYGSVVEITR